ncbi:glycosyltransferase family 2 protein [Micromonospora sp. NPDC092111]|uniref:glycosyltransferase family 2 protein n=1 Tax=Micromonospora sp. NPDC092111 TaxID=3364289 RepID=UPI003811E194
MKVSVVIPSYNSGPQLRACLATLNRQHPVAGHPVEVVVVDDGSHDGTGALVQDLGGRPDLNFDLQYHYLPRTAESGRAAARNHGIRAATGEIVVLVDADVLLPPGALAAHLDYHRRRPDLVVTGPRGFFTEVEIGPDGPVDADAWAELVPAAGADLRDQVLAALSDNLNNLATAWHLTFSCNVSVRREHLLTVGGFDDSFTGWGLEDSELGYRLHRLGLAFAYNRDAVVYHQHAQILTDGMYRDWVANLVRFTAKYPTDPAVTAQWVLDRVFDRVNADLTWLECYRRFEAAVRALNGRLPERTTYEVIEVNPGNLAEVRASLPERAKSADLLVFDETGDSELAATIQCLNLSRELAYFRRPSAEDRAQILAAHPTARPSGDDLCRR